MNPSIITEHATSAGGTTWRFCEQDELPFDPVVFDREQLASRRLLTGQAGAGRGSTCFFTWHGKELVLRQYRRGGLARHLSRQHYVYTGLENTRAMREFDILMLLCRHDLPVSPPFACQVVRRGPFYQASLVTHRLPGQTLAEHLSSISASGTDGDTWHNLGTLIGRMHGLGVCHADLNAHNLLINSPHDVFLIDFDRAAQRRLPPVPTGRGWCRANLQRLQRSLHKLAGDDDDVSAGFVKLQAGWQLVLQADACPQSRT